MTTNPLSIPAPADWFETLTPDEWLQREAHARAARQYLIALLWEARRWAYRLADTDLHRAWDEFQRADEPEIAAAWLLVIEYRAGVMFGAAAGTSFLALGVMVHARRAAEYDLDFDQLEILQGLPVTVPDGSWRPTPTAVKA